MKLHEITAPPGKYFKLEDGDNTIRVVSDPEISYEHYDEEKKKSISCIGKEKQCYYCLNGTSNEKGEGSKKVIVRYNFYIIDRRDGKIKETSLPWGVVKKYQSLAATKDFGFTELPDYDMTIQKSGKGILTKYELIPARASTPLTDVEKEELAALPLLGYLIAERKDKAVAENGSVDVKDLNF